MRYDSEADLETHELGRALLHMVRDDAAGLPALPSGEHRHQIAKVVEDPFCALRDQLAAVDSALCDLQPQVLAVVGYSREFVEFANIESAYGRCCFLCAHSSCAPLALRMLCCSFIIQTSLRWLESEPRPIILLISPSVPYQLTLPSGNILLCVCFALCRSLPFMCPASTSVCSALWHFGADHGWSRVGFCDSMRNTTCPGCCCLLLSLELCVRLSKHFCSV